jgi:hypothetical protein
MGDSAYSSGFILGKEAPVNAFIVDLKNKPGELAKVAEAIAQKGIDILGFTGATCGDSGTVALITNDEAGTQRVLTDGQWKYRPIELVTAELAQKPGSLAQATRRLADAGVNIESAVPTGMSGGKVQVAFATDNPVRARQALGEGQPVGAQR